MKHQAHPQPQHQPKATQQRREEGAWIPRRTREQVSEQVDEQASEPVRVGSVSRPMAKRPDGLTAFRAQSRRPGAESGAESGAEWVKLC